MAPYGSLVYRLSCPGLGNGSPRYYPAAKGWRLRPFEQPAVPWRGIYKVHFYDEDGELLGEAEAPVTTVRKGTKIGSGDHRRQLKEAKKGAGPERKSANAR